MELLQSQGSNLYKANEVLMSLRLQLCVVPNSFCYSHAFLPQNYKGQVIVLYAVHLQVTCKQNA